MYRRWQMILMKRHRLAMDKSFPFFFFFLTCCYQLVNLLKRSPSYFHIHHFVMSQSVFFLYSLLFLVEEKRDPTKLFRLMKTKWNALSDAEKAVYKEKAKECRDQPRDPVTSIKFLVGQIGDAVS